MKRIVFLLSIPKTLYVNFRYLSLKQAFKLPLAIHYNTKVNVAVGEAVRELNLRKIVVAKWQEKPLFRRIITLM